MKITKWIFIIVLYSFVLVSCDSGGGFDAEPRSTGNDTGKGGSLNKFAVIGDFLYVLDHRNIKTFKAIDGKMQFMGTANVFMEVETLYPFNNFLLIGSSTGMSIFEIDPIGLPRFVSNYSHIEACDPVVTDGNYAYVTLSTSNRCRNVNRLDILDVSDFQNPDLLISYDLFNPKGLGVDGNLLFVCDGTEGLKIFNIDDPLNMQLIKQFNHFKAVDVIPYNGNLLVVASDALYQFDYTDSGNIHEVSKLVID